MSTDPVTLAREVLDDERAWAALDPGHHPESQAAVYRLANAAPTLARAVIDLTTKVERMEALADRLDVVANELEADGEDGYADAARTDAHSIRAALNGENHA
ncbi:hypothetical protein M3C81_000685 [Micrococcus luteus]|nr:hypothetical protein [Micrococcus luteus]